jgi:hypothetical protein
MPIATAHFLVACGAGTRTSSSGIAMLAPATPLASRGFDSSHANADSNFKSIATRVHGVGARIST